eukprot:2885801-Rhodomonas_salina.1
MAQDAPWLQEALTDYLEGASAKVKSSESKKLGWTESPCDLKTLAEPSGDPEEFEGNLGDDADKDSDSSEYFLAVLGDAALERGLISFCTLIKKLGMEPGVTPKATRRVLAAFELIVGWNAGTQSFSSPGSVDALKTVLCTYLKPTSAYLRQRKMVVDARANNLAALGEEEEFLARGRSHFDWQSRWDQGGEEAGAPERTRARGGNLKGGRGAGAGARGGDDGCGGPRRHEAAPPFATPVASQAMGCQAELQGLEQVVNELAQIDAKLA